MVEKRNEWLVVRVELLELAEHLCGRLVDGVRGCGRRALARLARSRLRLGGDEHRAAREGSINAHAVSWSGLKRSRPISAHSAVFIIATFVSFLLLFFAVSEAHSQTAEPRYTTEDPTTLDTPRRGAAPETLVWGGASPPPQWRAGGRRRRIHRPRRGPGCEETHRHPLHALASRPLPSFQTGGLLLLHDAGLPKARHRYARQSGTAVEVWHPGSQQTAEARRPGVLQGGWKKHNPRRYRSRRRYPRSRLCLL
jgi:hypothetical protein